MCGFHRTSTRVIFALGLFAALIADTQRVEAQWHIGGGIASIHSSSKTGVFFAGGILWPLDAPGRFRLGGDVSLGTADQGYTTLQLDAQIHPVPSVRVSPFVGVQAGLLGEPEFGGAVLTGIAGIVVPLRPNRGIRIAGGWANHGDTPGPNFLLVALEFGGRSS